MERKISRKTALVYAMTERQRKLNLALARLLLIEQAELTGEKKVSRAQSRMLSPAIFDILTKEPMMVKACQLRKVDINALAEKATKIQFLLKQESSDSETEDTIPEITEQEETANDTESITVPEESD